MKQLYKNKIVCFLSAQTISLLGSSIVQFGMIWYITLTTTSGLMLTISTLCGFLPQIIIALFAGSWIDKYDAKKVVMLSDSMIALATLILAITFLCNQESIWLVFVVLAIRSLGTGIQTPCVNTIIPMITPSDKLMKINGMNSTLNSLTTFLSPVISGMLMSIASLDKLLLIDVVTALIGVGITATIAIPRKEKEKSNPSRLRKQGMQYICTHKNILRLFVFQILIYFLITPSAFLTPLMVARRFGEDVWRLSMSEMSYSLGMIAGGILISLWGGFTQRCKTMVVASVGYGLLMIGLGIAPIFIVYLCINTLIGIVTPCYGTSITVYLQEQVEQSYHGRVFSFMQIATSSAFPLGMCVFGPLADKIAIPLLLLVCGIFVILVTIQFKIKMNL